MKKKFTMTMQKKVLLLVLVPLFITTLILVTKITIENRKQTEEVLKKRQSELIDGRKAAVRDVVKTAYTSIKPLLNNSDISESDARQRAKESLRSIEFDDGNYIFVYDYNGTNLVLPPSPEREGTDMMDVTDMNGNLLVRDLIEIAKNKGEGFYTYIWNHPQSGEKVPKHSYAIGVDQWEWMIGAGVYVSDIEEAMVQARHIAEADLRQSIITNIIFSFMIFGSVALLATLLARRTMRPIRTIADAMRDIANGKGDLTKRLKINSQDELGELAKQFNAFVIRIQDTLQEVRISSQHVFKFADEIADSSKELATRIEESASSLQETSASMEEISSTVAHTADATNQGNQLAHSAASVAEEGQQAIHRVEMTMADISKSDQQVGDIIKMIDGIAFQTNILSLNASVEAARAGEHGKGFAVVASEVRALASRSADAAREIRQLIDDSSLHTKEGTEIVAGASEKIRSIAANVTSMTNVIEEISAGASEQSAGVNQINTAISEMDTMTQKNASMVQNTSSAAAEMQQHANRLNTLVESFILTENGTFQPDQPEQHHD